SLLEGVLLDILQRNIPRVRQKKARFDPKEAGLADCLVAAAAENLIRSNANRFASEFVKHARNWVHPRRLKYDSERPNDELARLGLSLAATVLRDLEDAVADGRLTEFERPLLKADG